MWARRQLHAGARHEKKAWGSHVKATDTGCRPGRHTDTPHGLCRCGRRTERPTTGRRDMWKIRHSGRQPRSLCSKPYGRCIMPVEPLPVGRCQLVLGTMVHKLQSDRNGGESGERTTSVSWATALTRPRRYWWRWLVVALVDLAPHRSCTGSSCSQADRTPRIVERRPRDDVSVGERAERRTPITPCVLQ